MWQKLCGLQSFTTGPLTEKSEDPNPEQFIWFLIMNTFFFSCF